MVALLCLLATLQVRQVAVAGMHAGAFVLKVSEMLPAAGSPDPNADPKFSDTCVAEYSGHAGDTCLVLVSAIALCLTCGMCLPAIVCMSSHNLLFLSVPQVYGVTWLGPQMIVSSSFYGQSVHAWTLPDD